MGATEFLTTKFNSTHPPLSSASRQSKVRLYVGGFLWELHARARNCSSACKADTLACAVDSLCARLLTSTCSGWLTWLRSWNEIIFLLMYLLRIMKANESHARKRRNIFHTSEKQEKPPQRATKMIIRSWNSFYIKVLTLFSSCGSVWLLLLGSAFTMLLIVSC